MKKGSHTRTNIESFPIYEVPRVVRFIETEGRVVLRGVGVGSWHLRDRVSILQDEKHLKMDGGDGFPIL